MRIPKPIPEKAVFRLGTALKKAQTKAAYQRVQCLWLRAALGLSSDQVAAAIGWRPTSVRRLQSRYLHEGERALEGTGRGGRRRQNLTLEQERGLLSQFAEKGEQGGLLVVSEVRAAYEKAVGHRVPKSTVYRMLARHGWRKITPRPRHPQSDRQRREAFKKTPAHRGKGSEAAGPAGPTGASPVRRRGAFWSHQ